MFSDTILPNEHRDDSAVIHSKQTSEEIIQTSAQMPPEDSEGSANLEEESSTNNSLEMLRETVILESAPIEESVKAAIQLYVTSDYMSVSDRQTALRHLKIHARTPHGRKAIYDTGELENLISDLKDSTVMEDVSALLINMLFHVPGLSSDEAGMPQDLYAKTLTSAGLITNIMNALAKGRRDRKTRAQELLLLGLSNLTSHGAQFKDEICECKMFPKQLSASLISPKSGVVMNATKLFNALCCQSTQLCLDRVEKMSCGGIPASIAALFLDTRECTTKCSIDLVPVLLSIFQQHSERFCRCFASNAGDIGVKRLMDEATSWTGSPKPGYKTVSRQLGGIKWWIDACKKSQTPLFRAVVILNRRRGSPPAYIGLKRQLVTEFGEDMVSSQRKQIQELLEKRHSEHAKEIVEVAGEYIPQPSVVSSISEEQPVLDTGHHTEIAEASSDEVPTAHTATGSPSHKAAAQSKPSREAAAAEIASGITAVVIAHTIATLCRENCVHKMLEQNNLHFRALEELVIESTAAAIQKAVEDDSLHT